MPSVTRRIKVRIHKLEKNLLKHETLLCLKYMLTKLLQAKCGVCLTLLNILQNEKSLMQADLGRFDEVMVLWLRLLYSASSDTSALLRAAF